MENLGDTGGVGGAVAGECDGGDWREETGEFTDAVGDAGDFAAEGDGDDDGVEGGAVVADVEVAGVTWRWWWRTVATDYELDAEDFVGVANYAFREREVEVDSEDGEDEAEGDPGEGDGGVEWVWSLNEAAVMEDDSALETILWDWFCCFAGRYHVPFLLIININFIIRSCHVKVVSAVI